MKNPSMQLILPLSFAFMLFAVAGCERKDPNHPEVHDARASSSAQGTAAASSTPNTSSATTSSFTAVSSLTPAGSADRSDFATDAWVGKWNGPEGTFLDIEGGKGVYKLTIQNLDGPTEYDGKTLGDRITFDRNGTTETIHVSDGKDTGMKWLADKKNCLKIRDGEGYCRD